MSQIPVQFLRILTSQGPRFVCCAIFPICVLNTLPFLSRWFRLSKTHTRILLPTVIGIDAVLAAFCAYATHRVIYSIKYDTWMHLAIIRRGLENGLFAGDPFYPNYPPPPHYSLVDVLYIYASKLTGIAPHLLWAHASFLVVALLFLACVWWHRELFDDSQLGWLGGLLFILSTSAQWHYATYPRNVALIPFFACLVYYFRSANRIWYVVHAGLAFGICVMSHMFTAIMCATFVMVYVLLAGGLDAIHRKHRRWLYDLRRLAFIPIGCILASPWLFVFGREALTHTETSMAHYSLANTHIAARMFGWTFTMYAPGRMLEAFPTIVWVFAGAGLLICLYHMIRGTHKPLHVFLVSTLMVPVVVLLSPLYSPIVRLFGEWMPARFVTVMSVPALAALTWGTATGALPDLGEKRTGYRLIIRGAGLLLVFTFMVVVIGPVAIMQSQLYETQNLVSRPLSTWDNDIPMLEGMFKDKVVLTDPMTSYAMPYYTGAYVVAIPLGHGSPYIDHESRIADVTTMFDPNTSPAKRYEMLHKYHVDYIVLNLRPQGDNAGSQNDWVRNRYLDSCKAMFGGQNAFRMVYDVNGLVVYQYSGAALSDSGQK
ncbi:MAG TPA: hypothetical protein VMP11_06820 [Verrucomicrobiae bacterium]|nr:hypothetical protein [Verrucomicrobiae bacterium]